MSHNGEHIMRQTGVLFFQWASTQVTGSPVLYASALSSLRPEKEDVDLFLRFGFWDNLNIYLLSTRYEVFLSFKGTIN